MRDYNLSQQVPFRPAESLIGAKSKDETNLELVQEASYLGYIHFMGACFGHFNNYGFYQSHFPFKNIYRFF
jgi:hypothetical protein